jgi:hypothetical protein
MNFTDSAWIIDLTLSHYNIKNELKPYCQSQQISLTRFFLNLRLPTLYCLPSALPGQSQVLQGWPLERKGKNKIHDFYFVL